MNPQALRFGAAALTLSLSCSAETLEEFAYRSGSDVGRALYCQEPTAGRYARLAERRLRLSASAERREALRLFGDAARIRAAYGPIEESCEAFLATYRGALKRLSRDAGPDARLALDDRRRPQGHPFGWQRLPGLGSMTP